MAENIDTPTAPERTQLHRRRPNRWVAGIVCLPVLYLAAAPVAELIVRRGLSGVATPTWFHAYPWISVVTAPARYYVNHEEIPGSELYADYCRWVWKTGGRFFPGR